MKIIHIISGILLFLLIAASSASAYELDDGTSNTASKNNVKVTAVYSANTITFTATSLTGGSANIKEVGFMIDPSKVTSITDNLGQNWALPTTGGNHQMDGLGTYLSVSNIPANSQKPSVVTVTLTDQVTGLITKNGGGYETCAHVAWNGGEGGVSGSAFVSGKAEIPEFPTVAVPVAAIFGLLFITQRRKEN